LLNIYYENEKQLPSFNDDFVKYIINKLNKIGMPNIWREQLIQHRDFSKDTKLLTCIRKRLNDISSQTIISALGENQGKLIFLKQTKQIHNFESYLRINNFENRRAITQLRTSSHKLEIETGRWNKIPRNQRICKNCILNKIEDENHLLFECQMYTTERNELYNTIKSKIKIDLSHSETHEKKFKRYFILKI